MENPDAKKEEKLTVIRLRTYAAGRFSDNGSAAARPAGRIEFGSGRFAPHFRGHWPVADCWWRVVERVQKLEEIHKLLDVDYGQKPPIGPIESPQLEIYSVAGTDPAAVLQVMQTLLAGLPDVRLATDPKTGNLDCHGPAIAACHDSRNAETNAARRQRSGSGNAPARRSANGGRRH